MPSREAELDDGADSTGFRPTLKGPTAILDMMKGYRDRSYSVPRSGFLCTETNSYDARDSLQDRGIKISKFTFVLYTDKNSILRSERARDRRMHALSCASRDVISLYSHVRTHVIVSLRRPGPTGESQKNIL